MSLTAAIISYVSVYCKYGLFYLSIKLVQKRKSSEFAIAAIAAHAWKFLFRTDSLPFSHQ